MQLRSRSLAMFWTIGEYPHEYPRGLERQLMRRLQMLSAAREIKDLKVPPGNRLERLGGNLEGRWSIRVNRQWRLVFVWDDDRKEAVDVYFDDYHK